MRVRISLLALLAFGLTARIARGDGDFKPEEGIFGAFGPPDAYDLALREALIGKDTYRLCQLVIVPAFAPESIVYIDRSAMATYGQAAANWAAPVVSRTFRTQLSKAIQEQIDATHPRGVPYSRPDAEKEALEKIHVQVETHTAELDAEAIDVLDAACRAALLRVRYPREPTMMLDGNIYHAGHFILGAFLAGEAHSPAAGTVADDLVQLERALGRYAEAPADRRPGVRQELLDRARKLVARLKSAPDRVNR